MVRNLGDGLREGQVGIQERGQLLDAQVGDGRQASIQVRVHRRAGLNIADPAGGDRGEACGIGRCHQAPQVAGADRGFAERGRIDRSIRQVEHRAVVDEIHQVGPEVRIVEDDLPRPLDQRVAEHDAVPLIGQIRTLLGGARQRLERRLEDFGERVADGAGEIAEERHAERDIGDHLHRLGAELIDDAHGDLRHKQDGIDEQHARQPLPADQLVRHEGVGNRRRYKTAEGDHRDRLQVRVRTHDRGDRIEDAVKAVVIAVGVDLVHTRTLACPLA